MECETRQSERESELETLRRSLEVLGREHETLRQSEARLRALFAELDSGFCIIEVLLDEQGTPKDYRFLETNAAFEEATGLHDAIGKTALELVPGLSSFWIETYGNVALTGIPARFEHQEPAMNGRWFDVYTFRVGEAQSRQAAIHFTNITDRKRAEADTARLAALVASSRDAITGTTPEGIITSWNPGAEVLYGYTAAEAIDRDIALIFPADRAEERTSIFARLLGGELLPPLDTVRLHKHGRRIEVEVRVSTIEDGQGRIVGTSAIARDTTERKRLERAQQDFIAMAGHDLATPVTVLRARAQLMQRRRAYDEEGLAAIVDQTQRMERLIDDLRDLTRMDAGLFILRPATTDLREIVSAAVSRVRLQAEEREIVVDVPSEPLTGEWDTDRLGQVLDNLLGNAVKHSGDTGAIVVRVAPDAAEARVSVIDRGDGIPAHALPRLFDRHYQVDRNEVTAGLGLGLYIARMLVEAHGGRLWAESTPGEGSTFTFVLPRSRVAHMDSG